MFSCAAYLNRHTTRVFMDITSNKQGGEIKVGYKQTEVGVIPEDWNVQRVKDSYEICNNLRFPLSEMVRKEMQGQYPLIMHFRQVKQ